MHASCHKLDFSVAYALSDNAAFLNVPHGRVVAFPVECMHAWMLKISFESFRHWKGTVEYHRTKDIYYVKEILGHKKLSSTQIYIHYEKMTYGLSRSEEFTVRVATNVEESCQLVEAGFDYVTGEYNDGGKIFRT